jgi:hypothetical protein
MKKYIAQAQRYIPGWLYDSYYFLQESTGKALLLMTGMFLVVNVIKLIFATMTGNLNFGITEVSILRWTWAMPFPITPVWELVTPFLFIAGACFVFISRWCNDYEDVAEEMRARGMLIFLASFLGMLASCMFGAGYFPVVFWVTFLLTFIFGITFITFGIVWEMIKGVRLVAKSKLSVPKG